MRHEQVWPLPVPVKIRRSRGARLACEAVVSRAQDGARLLSPCALVGEQAEVATQSADSNRVCITMSPCLPRPRKRGALYG